jgi:hypothetical protein
MQLVKTKPGVMGRAGDGQVALPIGAKLMRDGGRGAPRRPPPAAWRSPESGAGAVDAEGGIGGGKIGIGVRVSVRFGEAELGLGLVERR